MSIHRRILPSVLRTVAVSALLCAALAAAQNTPVAPVKPARPTTPAMPSAPASEQDLAATQDQLIKLLRISPTLTSVLEHDPSLLSNQDYVQHNNPELARFLVSHPEITRNPEFYLFNRLGPDNGLREGKLQRAVWPEFAQVQANQQFQNYEDTYKTIVGMSLALLAFACFMGALIWLIRQFSEGRRWARIFKLQSEVHGKLIDRFTSNQDLALYMDSEAGKRFLEAAPIPVGFEPEQRVPNALARVLTPLQIGIVMVLLGIGLLALRKVSAELNVPMLVLGTVVLMPGVGFIVSAGITWILAGRLGLMPDKSTAVAGTAPINSPDRQ